MNLFDYARAKALDGMTRAVEHADAVTPDWSSAALDALRAYVAAYGAPFTAEMARTFCHAHYGLPTPPDGRAWGAVFKRAAARKIIRSTGTYAPRACGNMTPTIVWERA